MILALDPSSSCVGYAVLTGLAPCELVEAGRLNPSMAKDAIPNLPPWLHTHMRQNELKATWRIAGLMRDALALVKEHQPRRVIVETPSGLTGTGAKRGARGSLTTYGMAAGAIWASLDCMFPGIVAPVTERQWTKDRGDKFMAQAGIAALYSTYEPSRDKGADVSDAIGLARWWIQNHK